MPGPALADVGRNGGVRSGRLEEFEHRTTHGDAARSHTFGRDFLRRFDFQAERVFVEGQRLVDILDGDADVIEDRFHPGIRDPGLGIRFMISSTTEYGSRARLATASI